MQSVTEDEFEQRHRPTTTTAVDLEAGTQALADTPAANQRELTEAAKTAVEASPDLKFDVDALESELDLKNGKTTFKPADYSTAASDRIIIGYHDGEVIYKAQPKPKPEPKRLREPKPRLDRKRQSASSPAAPESMRLPAERPQRPSERSQRHQRSTHQLYQERRTHKPGEKLGEFDETDSYDTATRWIIKATHIAAIAIALLLILHYFPVPTS